MRGVAIRRPSLQHGGMTGIVYDSIFKQHDTGEGHPECPARIDAIGASLEASGTGDQLQIVPVREATIPELCLAHDREYVLHTLGAIERGARFFGGGDVPVSYRSGDVARRAVGATLNAVDMIMKREVTNAFSAVRPPGHHATPREAMGFCLFNQAAIAARYIQKTYSLHRVAIIDWDVHHGNGTQDIFYRSPYVFFFSTHQSPWYPGTGSADEIGEGEGEGYTMNRPFPEGAGRDEILGAFQNDLLPALETYQPQFIILSAGFDSRLGDPLGGFTLLDQDFADLTRLMVEAAATHCEGRLLSCLEGGYSLTGLTAAAAAHLGELGRA